MDRAAVQVPPDYATRVQRLVTMGWPASLAAQALDSNHFVGVHAINWLQKNHPLPPKHAAAAAAAGGGAAAAASSSSSSSGASAAAAAAASSVDVPCIFERLPALLAPNNDNYLIAPPPYSAADASAASSPAAAAAASSVAAMPLVWNCAVCTFENALGSRHCDMCGTVHVASAMEVAARSHMAECLICFEGLAKETAFATEHAKACGHYLCVDDARAFIKSRLESGQLSSAGIRCCGDGPCQRVLSDSELRQGLTPHDYARLARFQRLHALTSDPSVVFCPTRGCDVVMFGVAGESRKLTCPDCRAAVCFHCRVQWHEGQSCEGWAAHQLLLKESGKAKELASGEQLFHQYLQQQGAAFRQCRKCCAWVEKTEGCDKVSRNFRKRERKHASSIVELFLLTSG